MFKKRLCALALCAALTAGATLPAAAEVYSASVVHEYAATKAIEWDGKTVLEAGKSYVVTKNVTVSKKITVPSKTTLTVKNGAKLTVSSKGSLYIRGTVNVYSKSTLSVSGKLYEYSTKKLTVNGTLNFTKIATVTINGTLTVNSNGKITGEPKSITLGKNPTITIKGKCTCEKLNKLLKKDSGFPAEDEAAIIKLLEDSNTAFFVKGDMLGAMKASYPQALIDVMKEELDNIGYDMEQYYAYLSQNMVVPMIVKEFGGMPDKISFDNVVLTYADPATIKVSEETAKFYPNIESACTAKVSCTLNVGTNTYTKNLSDDLLVKVDGKWYLLISESE